MSTKKRHKTTWLPSSVAPQLITGMPITEYLRYHPWSDALTEKKISQMCLELLELETRLKDYCAFCALDDAYYNEEFLRSPQYWDWVLPEERYPPEIRDWKRKHRMRFDGGQGLSDRKRSLIQSIVEPIWEDAKYTFGRAKDLLEEVRQGIAMKGNVIQTRNFMMHRDFLLRTIRAIDSGLSAETDAPQYTKAAIVSLLTPMMREQDRLYQDLLEALGIADRSIGIN